MKRSLLFLVLLACWLVTSGCASGPKFREVSGTFPALGTDEGRIYIYRTTTFGGAIQPSVRLDEQRVGKAIPKGFFFVDRSPGGYQIATSTEVDRTLSLTLEQGQIRFVRLDVSMGFMVGHVYPVLVDDAVGKKEIENCSYTGTSGK